MFAFSTILTVFEVCVCVCDVNVYFFGGRGIWKIRAQMKHKQKNMAKLTFWILG